MPARSMIDLVGRAAERLDLNSAEPARRADEAPEARLEPTILASLAADPAMPAPEPPRTRAALLDSVADAQAAEEVAARDRTARIAAALNIKLDWDALAKAGYLTPHTQNSLKAEEFRAIKRPLLRAAFGSGLTHIRRPGNAHMMMITSPHAGDGKTFTALNLAVSIAAERDLQVLLIDADIRSRGLSKALGITDRPGLSDLLAQTNAAAQTVTLRTDLPSLSVIPAGSPMDGVAPGPTEMLASQAMTRLVHNLADDDKSRVVIFDAPPALAATETGVLAGHVGLVAMVARANETSRRAVSDALDMVNACPTVSFILNQVSRSAVPQRFGYYGAAAAE